MGRRWSKNENKMVYSGSYKSEETAAHASDTLARMLMANGEKNHILNFPYENTKVHPERTRISKYFGVVYSASDKRWIARRWSKRENRTFNNGTYKDEETAAHASDTLARKLMVKGEKGHKLNFPNHKNEVERAKSSKYFGVTYLEKSKNWCTQRWSKNENRTFNNGTYKDEETAAHASDTLARKLMVQGEKGHKLNFPNDSTEIMMHAKEYQTDKRKRSLDFDSQTNGSDREK